MKRLLLVACVLLMGACAKDIYDLTGDIQGVVKDYSDGHLITNCLVSLQPSGKSTLTDSQGQFSFEDLTPGEYSLVFNKSGYNEESKKVTVITGQITEAMQLLRAKSPFSLSESLIDFGDFETQKTLMLFNNTDSKCSYTISNVPSWLSLSAMTGSLPAEGTNSLTLTINKDRVSNYGEYSQTLTFSYSGRSSGDVNLVVKFKKVQKTKPTVTCASKAENITETSFTISGELTATGGQLVTSYGHCWSLSPNPTIANNRNNNGTTTEVGKFESSLSGLTTATTYYVRAYAENASGVAYSNQVVVTTNDAYSNKWDGSKASSFAKGSGTASNPYIIETGAQLVLMKDYSSSHFKLNNNIDLDNRAWPVVKLSGSFDGNGHTIYNLKISRNENKVGFISELSGTIKNLTIDGVYIDASEADNVGAFSGYGGSITDCTLKLNSNSVIHGYNYVGGIVGKPYATTISRCRVSSSSQSSVIVGNEYVGGICGYTEGEMDNCHVVANISGYANWIGGIVGRFCPFYYAGAEATDAIANCSYSGELNGNVWVGGIAGQIYTSAAIIKCCKVDASITVSGDYAGGICGDANWGYIVGCYSTGTLNSDQSNLNNLSGISPVEHRATICLCYSTMTSNHKNYYGLTCDASLTDCATVVATGWDSYYGNKTNCQTSSTNITEFLQSAYSTYADYYNFNNTWTWSGKVNGTTKSVSCPKLAWEE